MITLNNLVSYQKAFQINHKQLKFGSYYLGDSWDEVSGGQDIKYPIMMSTLEETRIAGTEKITSFTFHILDKVQKGLDNQTDTWNDCELIALDLITFFQQTRFPSVLLINTSLSIDHVTEFGDDELSGVRLKIDFRTPFEWDLCSIPIN